VCNEDTQREREREREYEIKVYCQVHSRVYILKDIKKYKIVIVFFPSETM
jgi:hypothetical protein